MYRAPSPTPGKPQPLADLPAIYDLKPMILQSMERSHTNCVDMCRRLPSVPLELLISYRLHLNAFEEALWKYEVEVDSKNKAEMLNAARVLQTGLRQKNQKILEEKSNEVADTLGDMGEWYLCDQDPFHQLFPEFHN